MDSLPKVLVVGSINMDLVIRCDQLPKPGETRMARETLEVCGGKGANQAVAAARVGAMTTMVGRVGDDSFADRLVANLKAEAIDVSCVGVCENCASGLATVAVEDSGQNSILVSPGANGLVSPEDVNRAFAASNDYDAMLVQLETPLETVKFAMKLARNSGVRVILDPAPAPQQPDSELLECDFLCPNESEAEALVGVQVDSLEAAREALARLQARGARQAAVTMGDKGVMAIDESGQVEHLPAFSIEAVDTTAAGDAFAGAFAFAWTDSNDFAYSLRFASAAGAIAASRLGAQPGLPRLDEVVALMKAGT